MKELNPIIFAHPMKKNGFNMRQVRVYIYSNERVVSFKSERSNAVQASPDYFCVCHIPDLEFVDTKGYMMSLIKRVHRERMNSIEGYKFEVS